MDCLLLLLLLFIVIAVYCLHVQHCLVLLTFVVGMQIQLHVIMLIPRVACFFYFGGMHIKQLQFFLLGRVRRVPCTVNTDCTSTTKCADGSIVICQHPDTSDGIKPGGGLCTCSDSTGSTITLLMLSP